MKKKTNNQTSKDRGKKFTDADKTEQLEGSEILGKLLEYCSKNNITVPSYSWNQNERKVSYILFKIDEQSMNSILKLLKFITFDKSILYLRYIKNPGDVFSLGIYIIPEKANEGFNLLLNILNSKDNIEIEDIDISRQLILKSLINHVVPESWIEIQEGRDVISIAVDPEYSNVYPSKVDVKPWSGNSVIANLLKGSEELMETLKKLESRTKNYKFLLKRPYKQDILDEFLRAENRSVKINLEKTSKRKEKSGESRVIVLEVNEGTSIETLAKEIMELSEYGYACITNFGQFEIDARDYDSPEEIVNAYKRSLEPRRDLESDVESDLWMGRFKNWRESINKKSKEIKAKFMKMKFDIIKTIKERIRRKDEREQK